MVLDGILQRQLVALKGTNSSNLNFTLTEMVNMNIHNM